MPNGYEMNEADSKVRLIDPVHSQEYIGFPNEVAEDCRWMR